MKRLFPILLAACASQPPPATPPHHAAGAPAPSAACVAARAARTQAADLERDGRVLRALAKLDEANAACPTERASSLALEAKLVGSTGSCKRLPTLPTTTVPPATTAACAPSKGDAATERAKMHEAFAAEVARDFARAKDLYLAAWAERHPSPRALEDAARMAGRAGDAAESRRLRDRALAEAEAAEGASPIVTEWVRVFTGVPRLRGDVLTLASNGKVIARDVVTGELRVLVDSRAEGAVLSRSADLAWLGTAGKGGTFWDVPTGTRLAKAGAVYVRTFAYDDSFALTTPSDTTTNGTARLVDPVTGEVKASFAFPADAAGFDVVLTPDDAHVFMAAGDDKARVFDVTKKTWGADTFAFANGSAATTPDGHVLAVVERGSNPSIRVRDMVASKDLASWSGAFYPVESIGISPDGKIIATGSYHSLRLWDVATKKQLFKQESRDYARTTSFQQKSSFAFSDDGKTLVFAGDVPATAWDVATGATKTLVTDQAQEKIRGVVLSANGAAFLLEDEIRIVPKSGDVRVVCKGERPLYEPVQGPTSAAFSASGRSFACAMVGGAVHVFDATTWAERAVAKKAGAGEVAFSTDEKTLAVSNGSGILTLDAQTGAVLAKTTFKHPKVGLGPRHFRLDDGGEAVRVWNGALAIFGKDGAWQRDVKLPNVPMNALDAVAAGGSTYAVAVGTKLTLEDLATGDAHDVTLPEPAKTLALSSDGKTVVWTDKNGVVSTVVADRASPVPRAGHGKRAWIAGKSIAILAADDTIQIVPASGDPLELEVDPDGVVARGAGGAFEVRGKPEVECIVGKTYLSRETCADVAADDVVAGWLRAGT